MRIATMQVFQRGLDSMLDQQTQLYKTQLQLSSGQRFTSPADDPTAAAQVLGLSESIAITAQYQSNANAAETKLQREESVLAGVVDALQAARDLALQGNNATYSAEDRRAMAQEVRQITEHVLGLVNTQDANGEYLFSGVQSQTRPFSYDASSVGGDVAYAGDQGQRKVRISASREIPSGDSGYDVFMKIHNAAGNGYQDVLTTLHRLATDLEANMPDSDRITEIDNALEHTLQIRTRVGARLNAIERENDVNSAYSIQLQASLSAVRDLDMTQAVADLSRQTLVLQSAQQAFVRVQGLSLFNYL